MANDWMPLRVTYFIGNEERVSTDWEYIVVGARVRVRKKGWKQNVAIPIANPEDPSAAFAEAITYVVDELSRQ